MADQGEPRPAHRPQDARGGVIDRRAGGDTGGTRGGGGPAPERHAPHHDTPRFASRPAFAALDLGTNNCRLLIARPDGDDFTIVDAYSRIVRLGEGMTASGRISDTAMDRAVDALSICADKLRRRRVLLSRAVATEACRSAANGNAFIDRVYAETGIALDIISPEEEARLAVLGCHQLLSPGDGPALIFDIGGGSTELVLLDDRSGTPEIVDWQSIPWGVVSLTESQRHDSNDPHARAASYAGMRATVRDAVRHFASRFDAHFEMLWPGKAPPLRLLGTSGTVTTLASLYLDLPSYDRSKIDGLNVATDEMIAVCERLAGLSLSDREAMPCIGRERADLVVAGCAMLEEIVDVWPAATLDVADRGIREGVLRQMMRAHSAGEAASRRKGARR
jgi:exopolyphosphatase / guanosine-5'-triphosphate,3'-diphosphate pyrophosphatase